MATTSRVGIDIVAANKTNAAFASVQKNLLGLNSSLNRIKELATGGLIGGMLNNFVRGLIAVNAQAGQGKVAVDRLNSAYETFALQVGDAGLNRGMMNFAQSLNDATSGANGLAGALGTTLGAAFTLVGDRIAYASSRLQFFSDLYNQLPSISIPGGDSLAGNAANYLLNGGPLGQGMDAAQHLYYRFFPNTSNSQTVAPGKGDSLLYDSSNQTVSKTAAAMINVRSRVRTALQTAPVKPITAEDMFGPALAQDAPEEVLQRWGAATDHIVNMVEEQGKAIGAAFGDTFRGLIDGSIQAKDAIMSFARQALDSLSNLFLSQAFQGLSRYFGGGSPSQQGMGSSFLSSLFGGIAGSFGGTFANGGTIPAGKWGITGEYGPEIVRGPASVTPAGGGTTVVININGAKGNREVEALAEQAVQRGIRRAQGQEVKIRTERRMRSL